jgi:pantothenate kinase
MNQLVSSSSSQSINPLISTNNNPFVQSACHRKAKSNESIRVVLVKPIDQSVCHCKAKQSKAKSQMNQSMSSSLESKYNQSIRVVVASNESIGVGKSER